MARTLFRLRISRTTAISSANTVAKLTKNVSEALSFPPTKIAAEIVLQILETIKKVDDNDEAQIKLMSRVIDYLLILRKYSETSRGNLTPDLTEKIQEFEEVLSSIRGKLLGAGKKTLMQRVLSKDKIKGDLDAHAASIESEIEKLKASLLLHLDTNITVHARINQSLIQAESTNERSLVLQSPTKRDLEEEVWKELQDNYAEVPVGEILIEEPAFENAVVSFANLKYARIKGERRLVKCFNKENEDEKEAWLQELKYGHRLRRQNILQMQGFSKRNGPNLFVLFHNTQIRCLATYVLDLLTGDRDIPSIGLEFVKMANSALDAIRYTAKTFCMNKATAALIAQDARFALDPGNSLIVLPNPQRLQRKATISLALSLFSILWPPHLDKGMDRYLTGLTATKVALKSIGRNISERRAAVITFLSRNLYHDGLTGNFILRPISRSSRSPSLSAYIDFGSEVQLGDYGILVPGQQEEPSFHTYGNVADDSSGIISTKPSRSWLYNSTDGKYVDEMWDSPRIWSIDANRARLEGFHEFSVTWIRSAKLVDSSRAIQFLVNSVPLLPGIESSEDLMLITKIEDTKEYSISFEGPDLLEPDIESGIAPISPRPTINIRELDLIGSECEFYQCPPNTSPYRSENVENLKCIHYTRVKKEDLVKRFGFIPAFRREKRKLYSTGPITRSNRWW